MHHNLLLSWMNSSANSSFDTPRSSPPSSPSTSPRPLKRGRPQQEIEDGDDAGSQRRKHRRMYARQYRAQMRQKVDEVELLREKVDSLTKDINVSEMKRIQLELKTAQLEKVVNEAKQREAALNAVLSQLIFSVPPLQIPVCPSLQMALPSTS